MDFGTLLHVAKKNSETSKAEGNFYCTKFAPPKKESKDKKLSDNIQKFLAKQEQEDRERKRKEKEKLTNLLAMRDEKSKNKIRKMLKVTKSANKSVLDDVDGRNTAVTAQGPDQPDQDDYGYVSTEANSFYAKYMEKVKDVKDEKGFAPSRPQSLKDLSGTKERVKAAINQEIEDKKNPLRQPRTSSSLGPTQPSSGRDALGSGSSHSRIAHGSSKSLYDPDAERREEDRKKREEEQKKAKHRKAPPPPMNFQALLKLAEQKQHEPIEILQEVKKKKEPERLLTLKEKKEQEERERFKAARAQRDRDRLNGTLTEEKTNRDRREAGPGRMEPNGRIPKLNQTPKPSMPPPKQPSSLPSSSSRTSSSSTRPATGSSSGGAAPAPSGAPKKPNGITPTTGPPRNSTLSSSSQPKTTSSANSSKPPAQSPSSSSSSSSSTAAGSKPASSSALANNKNPYTSSNAALKNGGATREFPPRDTRPLAPKTKPLPPAAGNKTRQFPPPDVRRGMGGSRPPGEGRKPPPAAAKRRILDDDDEDDYDSEMDDFIDDNDCEDDYSSHIKAIFGYDKSRYRDVDEEDDAAMESNFAQVQREEYISKKLGIQEDLEDMKLEAMEKKRKMMAKKQKTR